MDYNFVHNIKIFLKIKQFIILVLFSVFLSGTGCGHLTESSKLITRLDIAAAKDDKILSANLEKQVINQGLTQEQKCELWRIKTYQFLKDNPSLSLAFIKKIGRKCQFYPDKKAWALFYLSMILEKVRPRRAIQGYERVIELYPYEAAAQPAIFRIEELAKRLKQDPSLFLIRAYKYWPQSSLAAFILWEATKYMKGKEKYQWLQHLAQNFPMNPFGRLAKIELAKRLASKDPVEALYELYNIAYLQDRSLLFGTYNLGVRAKAMLEAARIWDVFLHRPYKAEELYREFIRLHPNSDKCDDILYEVYEMYLKYGMKQKALSILKELAKKYPDRAMGMKASDMLHSMR